MSFRRLLFALCAVLFTSPLHAQYNLSPAFLKANSNWAFGYSAGLSFNSGGPIPVATAINTVEGCASVCDPDNGQLLFYSSGNTCWNRNNAVMPNGGSLQGNTGTGSAAQGVCIVPFIDSPGKYYLFSLQPEDFNYGRLYYSVVDMALDGGMGDIVNGRKNVLMATGLRESMIAVPGNHCDYWLITHRMDTALFQSYHLTAAGIESNPVLSQTGPPVQQISSPVTASIHYGIGCTAVSPDRTMLALAVSRWDNYTSQVPLAPFYIGTLLCRFDPETGKVSQAIRITEHTQSAYGVCFSPDNSRLYVNVCSSFNASLPEGLYQYSTGLFDSAAVVASRTYIDSSTSADWTNYLKLYNDTIYLSNSGSNAIERINRPNDSGIACDHQYAAIPMPGSMTLIWGLPNDVPVLSPARVAHSVSSAALCRQDSLQATDTGGLHYQWNDGTTGNARPVQGPGIYVVQYEEATGCTIHTDTFSVQAPVFNASVLVQGCKALLQVKDSNHYSYSWYDAGNKLLQNHLSLQGGDSLAGLGAGNYQVIMTTAGGCDTTLSFHIVSNVRASFAWDTACAGQDVVFYNNSTGNRWTWDFGDHSIAVQDTPVHRYAGTGYYNVQLIAGDSISTCSDTDHQTLLVRDFELQLLASDTVVNPGTTISLSTQASVPYHILAWSPDTYFPEATSYNQQIAPDSDVQVIVIGSSDEGCRDSASVRIAVVPEVFVPTAFTPNGDGRNDYFRPVGSKGLLKVIAFSVYDRWGQCVYSAAGDNRGWDGTHGGGRPAETGTYYYQLLVETGGRQTHSLKGNVTLLR